MLDDAAIFEPLDLDLLDGLGSEPVDDQVRGDEVALRDELHLLEVQAGCLLAQLTDDRLQSLRPWSGVRRARVVVPVVRRDQLVERVEVAVVERHEIAAEHRLVVPSALATFVPAALTVLRERRPRIDIQVDEGWSTDLVRLIAGGDLDLAVVSAGAGTPSGDMLLRELYVALLCADHALAARRRLSLRDRADEPWIVAPEPGGRQAVLAACSQAGFAPRIVSSAAWHAAERLIAIGVGVALAPAGTGMRLAREPGVVAKPLADVPVRELRLIRAPRARQSPAERDLETELRAAASSQAQAALR